jgi:hypothetical protein
MQPPKTTRGFTIKFPFLFWEGEFFMAPFTKDKDPIMASLHRFLSLIF